MRRVGSVFRISIVSDIRRIVDSRLESGVAIMALLVVGR